MGKVLHASKSGYFPFCIQESTSPACVFPLETIMKIYWRVKKFRLTGSGSGTYPPPFEYVTGAIDFEPVEIPQTFANSEENLVCASRFFFARESDASFGSIELAPTQIKKNINLFSLFFSASFPFGLQNSLGGQDEFSASYGPFATTNSPHSLNVFGVSMPIYITVGGVAGDENMGGSMQLTLTAIEYWSYGETYNTSTGEPL